MGFVNNLPKHASKHASGASVGTDPLYANSVGIDSSITVQLGAGGSVGGYSTGTTINANTPIQTILNTILQKLIPPTYTNPYATLSGTTDYEIGSSPTLSLTSTFVQNDAGAFTARRVYDGATQIGTTSPLSYATGRLTANKTFSVQFDYAQGPIKNDNLGNPYPTGRIQAGTATGYAYLNVFRKLFYAADTGTTAITTSTGIRSLTSSDNPSNGTQFSISIPIGTTRVTIAYPASLQNLTSVIYVEGLGANVTDTFSLTNVNVDGATAGYDSTSYKVYTYIAGVAFSSTATYNVTI